MLFVLDCLHSVTAKFPSQGGKNPVLESILLSGPESSKKRQGYDRGGYATFNCLLHSPAPFPRVFHISANLCEPLILGKGCL